MKAAILKKLKHAEDYVSGQDLCESLGVSRTAVWKVIGQLQEDGFAIEAVRNRGYHLVENGDVFTEAEIASSLETAVVGRNLVFLEQVDSTNNKVKQLAESGAVEGTLVIANEQSAAKGRRGRSWISPAGEGIWMSFLLRPKFPPSCASMLTLVAALGVNRGIRETLSVTSLIKWPNDIVVQGKKVCGILTEMSAELDYINHIVVGIGINGNIRKFQEGLSETATSLFLESGNVIHRGKLVNAVLCAWEEYYKIFLQTQDLSILREEYNSLLAGNGGLVNVCTPEGTSQGISRGITNTGELMVEKEDGTMFEVMSGEVSIRGIYGYV